MNIGIAGALLPRVCGAVFCLMAVFGGYGSSYAASCCGGGSSGSLLLPKFSKEMMSVSIETDSYRGLWNQNGIWVPDPDGSDLNQYRLSAGYAYRLAPRWQVSAVLPYVWNDNSYSGWQRSTDGLGDSSISLWYEAFDNVTCVWKVNDWSDLKPAVYWGGTLTVPTGVSPYDDVEDSFDITGRGFYRLDGSLMLEKTIYPFNATLAIGYGKYLKRAVNRRYGSYVEPYNEVLGDRLSSSLSLGYSYFTDAMDSLTATLSYNYLHEEKSITDAVIDNTSGFEKKSVTTTLAWSTADRSWVVKISWSRGQRENGWGRNFPVTDTVSLGVNHVLR